MSPYSIPPLVSSLLFFSLGLFCYLKNKNSRVNLSFALMCLTTVWWQGSWTILFNTKNPAIASILVKVGYSGIIFIPITFYQFTIEFLNRKEEKKLAWLSYALGIGFLISLWTTNLFIRGYYTFYWGYYPKAGLILHPVYLVMLSAQALRMLYLLYAYLKKKQLDPIKRNQVKYMFWAIFFYAFASADFADNYGLELYPFGFIPILIFLAITGHTIAKYRLLDIHFVIRKVIAYAWVVLLIAIGIGFIHFLPLSEPIKLSLYIFIASTFAILSTRIIPKAEAAINNILYKEKYQYQNVLEKYIEDMVLIPKEEELFKNTAKILGETLGVKRAAIFTLDHVLGDYYLRTQLGLSQVGEFRIPSDTGIAPWLRKHREVFIKEEMEKLLTHAELAPIKETLDKLEATVCVPALLKTDLMGIITLSEKSSGDMYSHIDTEILHRLGVQLAVAMDYRRIEAELRKEQELSAIGTMTAEISHELRNLLVSPRTFIELAPERRDDEEFFGNFRKLAANEIEKLDAKIGYLSHFGRPKALSYSSIDLNKILDAILIVNETKLKDIVVVKEFTDIPSIRCDRDQIKNLFGNLILNSIEAMETKPGGKLRIRTKINNNPLPDMVNLADEWIRVEIKDDGIGIPKSIMERLFTPFATTKSVGGVKEKGSGLGLAIAKKVVDAHKGKIDIRSTKGKGTTAVIDLPVRLKKEPPPPEETDYGIPPWIKGV